MMCKTCNIHHYNEDDDNEDDDNNYINFKNYLNQQIFLLLCFGIPGLKAQLLFIKGCTLSSLDDDNDNIIFIIMGRVMMITMVILRLKLIVGELEG